MPQPVPIASRFIIRFLVLLVIALAFTAGYYHSQTKNLQTQLQQAAYNSPQ